MSHRVLGNSLRLCLYELGGTRGTSLTYEVLVSTGTRYRRRHACSEIHRDAARLHI